MALLLLSPTSIYHFPSTVRFDHAVFRHLPSFRSLAQHLGARSADKRAREFVRNVHAAVLADNLDAAI